MVTIKDISREANVSTATVSKVLNGDYSKVSAATRDLVLDIAQRLNYSPNLLARGLASSKSKIVGLIIPDIANPYFADIADGVTTAGEEAGYQVMLCTTKERLEKEKQYVNTLAGYAVDGVIVASQHESIDALVGLLTRYRIPYVLIDNYHKERPYCVYVDDFTGAYTATQYLIENNHRRIAFIGGDSNTTSKYQLRLDGYLHAIKGHQLELDDRLVHMGSYTVETGDEFAGKMLDEGLAFTAIVCGNDMIAVGAMRAISRRGLKVPHDISVMGYDDTYLTTVVEPNLTTVKQPAFLIGGEAMKMLEQRIDKMEPEPLTRSYSPSLIVRGSVRRQD